MTTITSKIYKEKQEKILASLVYKDLQKQKKKFIQFLERQDQKWFKEDFEAFILMIFSKLPDIIYKKAKQVLQAWFNTQKKQFPDKTTWFDINWNLRNEEAVIYINNLKDLHLSQRKWSISRTTKLWMIEIIYQWVKDGIPYTEIAKQIQLKDPAIFSKSRSELIAIQEVGRAYEKWNEIIIRKLKNKWERTYKKWITAEDEKVRPAHRKNAEDWWIEFDINFSWTNSHIAPTWFRCRCSTIYEIR